MVITLLTLPLLAVMAGCSAAEIVGVEDELQIDGQPIDDYLEANLTASTPTRALSVLFVGNSYTYAHEMPEMVEAIAALNGVDLAATMVASGGYFLADHVADGTAATELVRGDYDVVVLQEQSIAPAITEMLANDTVPAAMALDAVADEAGTRVVWFQTWGRRDGLAAAGYTSFGHMQQALSAGYTQIATATGAEVAPVGESWQQIISSGVPIELFDADGSHPSPAGSFAAAVEITETILGAPVVLVPTIDGVGLDTARAIAELG